MNTGNCRCPQFCFFIEHTEAPGATICHSSPTAFYPKILSLNKYYREIFMNRIIQLTLCSTLVAGVHASDIEEVVVTAAREVSTIELAETLEITPDSAALLRKAPGANVNSNGPLSGIPQYRGMYGSRINVTVDGSTLSSGGPNWMDPPLHYAPAAQLESLSIYRGIAPVSAGQETIGGAITAKTWSGEFSDSAQFSSQGRIRAGTQSVNEGLLTSVAVVASNKTHRIKVAGLTESGDDAQFDRGDILHTEYERDRVDLGYGYQRGAHSWQFDLAHNETGDSGNPALPMDIEYIDADLASLSYDFKGEGWNVRSKIYHSEIDHGMSNFHLRQLMMGMNPRINTATGDSNGIKVAIDWEDNGGTWLAGLDGHHETHDSDITDRDKIGFFAQNFSGAEREVWGVFLERNQQLNSRWRSELGLRYNRVTMDSDSVSFSNPGNMMAAMMQMRAMAFNNSNLKTNDNNIDWVAKLYYEADQATSLYAGIARKTRSASYQERYLWMSMEATAGLADGKTYLGNLDLDAEVAHELEIGIDILQDDFSFSFRSFYKQVEDYIQGTTDDIPHMGMPAMPVADLKFNNVDAQLYGFDVEAHYQLDNHWSLNGIVNFVRGKRDDINDNLYRIAPLNSTVGITYQSNRWAATLESVLTNKQDQQSTTNDEKETAGHGLVNMKGYWQVSEKIRLGGGIDNLLDKQYSDHLGGYNRVANIDIDRGDRLPGYGRNVFARIDYQW